MGTEQKNDAGFLSKSNMGGITGGEGYHFQSCYIVSRVIGWLRDPDFCALTHEGAGDVDVRFERSEGVERWFVQVKNHEIGLAEARGVFQKQFLDSETKSPGTWQRFYLAAPTLHPEIERLRKQVERLQNLEGMHDPDDPKWQDTLQAIQGTVDKLKLPGSAEFLVEKVYFDTEGLADLKGERTLRDRFVLDLHEWSEHEASLEDAQAAYLRLLDIIRQGMGKTLSRVVLEEALRQPAKQTVTAYDDQLRQKEIDSLHKRLSIRERNLSYLEERKAAYGPDAPLKLLNDIEVEKEAIRDIRARLTKLGTR